MNLIKVSDSMFFDINEVKVIDLVGNTLFITIKEYGCFEIFDPEKKLWNKINEIYERNN